MFLSRSCQQPGATLGVGLLLRSADPALDVLAPHCTVLFQPLAPIGDLGICREEKDAEVKVADSSDEEAAGSELGLQSHWDGVYAEELATFHEHGQVGEIW